MWSACAGRCRLADAPLASLDPVTEQSRTLDTEAVRMTRAFWSDEEIAALRAAYESATTSEDLDLDGLADRLNRSRYSVAMKASRLGIADIARRGVRQRKAQTKYASIEEARAAMSRAAKERAVLGAVPTFAGHSHSEETKRKIAETSSARWAAMTPDERAAHTKKAMRGKAEKPGGFNGNSSRGSWRAGWREIGGKRNYYRSRWEANYARYLEWLRDRREIADWQHEPETFWFDDIKRGVRSYLPDFRVWEMDGSSRLHEVKGWMDSRSKTTLSRMAKYHPAETIVVIREKQYNEIARKIGPMISGWERGDRADRP